MKPTPPLTLLILAAGLGSRYGGLKQMDPVGPGGETIMDYSIHDAKRSGFTKVVFVIRRDMEKAFRETVGARFEKNIDVGYVFQELDRLPAGFTTTGTRTKPWGTGHAILCAAGAIREPFAVINADDFYGQDSFRVLAGHLASGGTDFAMVGFTLRNTLSEFGAVARGICETDSSGYLKTVTECTNIHTHDGKVEFTDAHGRVHPLTGEETVSMNIWGFTPALFPQLEEQFREFLRVNCENEKAEFYIPTAVNALVKSGHARCRMLRTACSWFGVTYREDRERVLTSIRALIARGEYPEILSK